MGKKKRKRGLRNSVLSAVGLIVVGVLTATLTDIGGVIIKRITADPPTPDYVVTSTSNLDDFGTPDFARYYFDKRITELSPPPSDTTFPGLFSGWAAKNGADDIALTKIGLAVTANSSSVILQGVNIVRKARLPVMLQTGSIVSWPAGGPSAAKVMWVNLDSGILEYFGIQTEMVNLASVDPNNGRFTYEVPKGKTETFIIQAKASKAGLAWTLALNILVNGKPVTKNIERNGGGDFRTRIWAESDPAPFYWVPPIGWTRDAPKK